MVDQLYFKQMMRTRKGLSETVMAPFLVLFFIFAYAMSSPQNYQQTGFLFFYPLYSDYTIQCLYTSGTWMWVFGITWLMHSFANKKFGDFGYKLFTGSALYAYVSHYFFIIMIAIFLIRPYKIGFIPALVIEEVGTNAIILLSYMFLNSVYELIFPPKERTLAKGNEEESKPLLKDQEVIVEVKE